MSRPVVNLSTVRLGTPVVSTAEDGASVGLSLAAIFLPILVLLLLALLAAGFVWLWRYAADVDDVGTAPGTARTRGAQPLADRRIG